MFEHGLLLILAFLLVLLNGFFVAAEFAMVKLRLTQAEELAQEHGLSGRTLLRVRKRLDTYLSACQLGITLASLGLGWVGEPAFAKLIAPPMHALGIASPEVIDGIAFTAAFTIISFLHIVLGELAPKSIAIRKPEPVSLLVALPLYGFYWLMQPFIWLLNTSANLTLKLAGLAPTGEEEDAHSRDEIKKVLAASHRHGEIQRSEVESATRVLDFRELEVGDFMRPARDMVMLNLENPIDGNLQIIDNTRYSRYPLYDGDKTQILGYVHVKDLFSLLRRGKSIELRSLLRPITYMHRDQPSSAVFERLKRGGSRFIIVDDDLGNYLGFVTVTHLIETLHGRIQDEFVHAKDDWQPLGDHLYEGDASLSIYSLERTLGFEVPTEGLEVDSIAGLIISRLDRIPSPGDRVDYDRLSIEVVDMEGPHVGKVRIKILPGVIEED